jgi:hypothetical protein
VQGRSGSPVDWAIDCVGIALAWLLWTRLRPAPTASRAR